MFIKNQTERLYLIFILFFISIFILFKYYLLFTIHWNIVAIKNIKILLLLNLSRMIIYIKTD